MVEGTSLENWRARKGTVGSNPTLSAKLKCLGESLGILVCWVEKEWDSNDRALRALAA